jgi:hypothetical protein
VHDLASKTNTRCDQQATHGFMANLRYRLPTTSETVHEAAHSIAVREPVDKNSM